MGMASQQGIDPSSRQYGDAEGRLSLQEVPDQISRIFFGDPQKAYAQGQQKQQWQIQKLRSKIFNRVTVHNK